MKSRSFLQDDIWNVVIDLIDERYQDIINPDQWETELSDLEDKVSDFAFLVEKLAKESE